MSTKRKYSNTTGKRVNRRYSAFTESTQTDRVRIMEQAYTKSLTEWSTTRFKWIGLPDTVDERFLETELFFRGFVLFYMDSDYDRYLAVRATRIGAPNVYENPTHFRTTDMPGYKGKELLGKDCVPVWSSYSRMTERDVVLQYAARLAEMDVSLQTVSRAMRVNTVISAPRSQKLTMMNVMKQTEEGADVVYTDETFNMESIQALNLGVNPAILSSLRDEKNQLWNEAMTMLGIDNANQDKKERLVVDEVSANNGQIMVARNAAMKARKEAAEQINRMYGLSVQVVWNADIPDIPSVMEEGDDNGNIYDGVEETS